MIEVVQYAAVLFILFWIAAFIFAFIVIGFIKGLSFGFAFHYLTSGDGALLVTLLACVMGIIYLFLMFHHALDQRTKLADVSQKIEDMRLSVYKVQREQVQTLESLVGAVSALSSEVDRLEKGLTEAGESIGRISPMLRQSADDVSRFNQLLDSTNVELREKLVNELAIRYRKVVAETFDETQLARIRGYISRQSYKILTMHLPFCEFFDSFTPEQKELYFDCMRSGDYRRLSKSLKKDRVDAVRKS